MIRFWSKHFLVIEALIVVVLTLMFYLYLSQAHAALFQDIASSVSADAIVGVLTQVSSGLLGFTIAAITFQVTAHPLRRASGLGTP